MSRLINDVSLIYDRYGARDIRAETWWSDGCFLGCGDVVISDRQRVVTRIQHVSYPDRPTTYWTGLSSGKLVPLDIVDCRYCLKRDRGIFKKFDLIYFLIDIIILLQCKLTKDI